ncbi:peptidoglycan recognition protein family protein [Candidatus Enterococcus courvalinii]|uniref:Peptidoglycan recognition protein n=1 Tax=Candidatus Enterococcus courvalinii TaxID=2815329 RepID=A0ABS3HZX6_9ENTE|nr:N-acetylmuramoyl-L-alanine amidase [Enterococcus sp. MSG2901]MBO0482014.1 peptidoglycan recognition protein [Enterococcus sp. MSG2901]
MVKIINNSVCRGVAGKRVGSVKGVVIHNTWTNTTAEQEMNRLASMSAKQLEAGFAHYYVDEKTIIRTEDTYNRAWHVANSDGNNSYLGYEVRGNRETPRAVFLQAEQNVFWQAAIDLHYYGLPVNRDTVKCHHQFSATECLKRSLMEHCGYDSTFAVPTEVTGKMQDYFITQIKKYYNNPALQPDGSSEGNNEHDEIIAASPAKTINGMTAKLDIFNENPTGSFRGAGWMIPGYSYGFVFLMDGTNKQELARKLSSGIVRDDVNQAYGLPLGSKYGLDCTFDITKLKGRKVYIMFRRTNDKDGNTIGGAKDIHFDEYVLTVPER